MEEEGRLYFVKSEKKSITLKEGVDGPEIKIKVKSTYPFNKLYEIDGVNIISIGTHNIYFFRLVLKDISRSEEETIYQRRISSYEVMENAIWTSDSKYKKELKEIARRGPILNIEIRIQDEGEASVIEHREMGEMDIICRTRNKVPINKKILSGTYAQKKDKEILRFQLEDKVESYDESDDIQIEQEKKPKEIVLEVESKNKKEAK